jgi:hypothetical protein
VRPLRRVVMTHASHMPMDAFPHYEPDMGSGPLRAAGSEVVERSSVPKVGGSNGWGQNWGHELVLVTRVLAEVAWDETDSEAGRWRTVKASRRPSATSSSTPCT